VASRPQDRATSASTWSSVQNTGASSWAKARARIRPLGAPDGSVQ
jgi:hypothetical protein